MLTSYKRIGGALLGLALGVSCAIPALADDSEIYVNALTPSPEVRPNILFIVDTSGSMDGDDVREFRDPFDKDGTYTKVGSCESNRIYFRRAGDDLPTCASTNYIVTGSNRCVALKNAVEGISGRWTGKTAQYSETDQLWRALQPNGTSELVECFADSGKEGNNGGSAKYARNGDKTNKWTTQSAAVIDWNGQTTYTFYSAKWMNWRYQPEKKDASGNPTVKLTRLEAVQQAVIGMTSSIDGVNLGLMRYSNNGGFDDEKRASGGYVVQAVGDVTANRADIIKAVDKFNADGYTPLSETLYEAYLYYAGLGVNYGNSSSPGKSVDASRTTSNTNVYKSPIIGECQKSYIIYLTDGLPTSDRESNDAISLLDHGAGGSCSINTKIGQNANSDGICLDDMAHYLSNNDLNTTTLKQSSQTVTTYTIGFGKDVKGLDFLTDVANAGKGARYDADNSESLTEILTKITDDVLNTSTTFSTASVGVNSFNRAQSRDDLYFAVFSPAETLRWDGNLKKYRLAYDKTAKSLIVSGTDDPPRDVVDATTGLFKEDAKSGWSAQKDGNDATAGGAASKLPATRTIYTYLSTNPAGGSGPVVALNTATNADLGDVTDDEKADIVDFAYSTDIKRMGDPLHSQPSVVTYTSDQDVVYLATNDGYLHAIDAKTGVEQWAFVPKELLPRLKQLLANPALTNRTYGLDGELSVLRYDVNGNGTIEGDDRVWLYFGMRRGGRTYYALDVTNPAKPAMLWFDNETVLPGVGETWSKPVIARVDVKDALQNSQKLVLLFGGGYDGVQENINQVDDSLGNRLFMVDAKSGSLLWYGTKSGDTLGNDTQKGVRTEFDKMKNSFPGRLTVIDTNGDALADRIYAGDMGGRVWRFDIFNGKGPADLVTGGVIAELGQGQVVSPAVPDVTQTRRFYNSPDVALVQRRGADPYYNIAIGSGYRGHPLNTDTVDRFYSLRDKQPFTKMSKQQYKDFTPITDGVLPDVSTTQGSNVDVSSAGWKYVFSSRKGEKVLSESTTASDVILLSTYQPDDVGNVVTCRPKSKNRVYAFKIDNGAPALDLNRKDGITKDDTYVDVLHEGILGAVNVGLLRGNILKDIEPPPPGPLTVCLAGMHILGQCVQVDDSVRTFWKRESDVQ